MSKLIITRLKGQILTALWDGNHMIQLQFDPDSRQPQVGDIYLGRVQNYLKNIQAAFIEIQPDLIGYYSIPEGEKPPVPGDEILVQLTREAVKTKAAVLSAELSLPGRYVVLVSGEKRVSVSNKITDRERREWLKELLLPYCGDWGYIVRTNSGQVSDEEIISEAGKLAALYQELMQIGKHRICFSRLYAGDTAYLTAIRDIAAADLTDIVTDQEDLHASIQAFLNQYQPEDGGKLSLYADPLLPLGKLYGLETVIEQALNRRVWLKSGGYLVIEPTETLTVIDVNTGKYNGRKKMEDTFFKINREAAQEIAAQLRLRNLSGIILVDFIDMAEEEHTNQLLAELEAAVNRDPVKTVLVDRTKLNLVELTRKKVRKPLYEQVYVKASDSVNR